MLADILAGFARYAEAAEALRKAKRTAGSEKWKEDPSHFFALQWGLMSTTRRSTISMKRSAKAQPTPWRERLAETYNER